MTTRYNTTVDKLLGSARAVLDGTIELPRHQAPRAAAFLGRQALEDLTRVLCERAGIRCRTSTMRARLIVLRLRERTVAEALEKAWHGLSRACHHHAFELSPTEAEVRELVALVASSRPHQEND